MKMNIREIICYGEVCGEYMMLTVDIENDYNEKYNARIWIAPIEGMVFDVDADTDIYCSCYESAVIISPQRKIEIIKYLTDKKIMKLLKILRETVMLCCGDMDYDDLSVSLSNKHYQYYYNKIYNSFKKGDKDDEIIIKEGETFYIDEHIKDK